MSSLDLDISSNGGSTWTTINHWTSNHGTHYGTPGENVTLT